MQAIRVDSSAADFPLLLAEHPTPTIRADEVLVEVRAAGVNRADLSQRAGRYPPPPGESEILGMEISGIVSNIGTAVSGWTKGDRVCALLAGGGYAAYAAVPASMLMRIPESLTFVEAAAIPEVFLTAYLNLFFEPALKPGESVLIHAGASGVGTAAIQLARFNGCRVFATVGTDEKASFCRQLGADLAVNYRSADFFDEVQRFTKNEGVDVVLDMVGASYMSRDIDLLKIGGRIIVIAFMGGVKAEIDLAALMTKRATIRGSVMRGRERAEKARLTKAFADQYLPAFASGKLKVVIDSVFPLSDAGAAHQRLQQSLNIGKVILEVMR